MSARVWVRNSATGAVRDVAASAVPIIAASGWVPLTEKELADLAREQDGARAERLAALTPASAAAEPVESAPAPANSRPAPAKSDKNAAATAAAEKQES